MPDDVKVFETVEEAEHAEIAEPRALVNSFALTEPRAFRWMERALATIRALFAERAEQAERIAELSATLNPGWLEGYYSMYRQIVTLEGMNKSHMDKIAELARCHDTERVRASELADEVIDLEAKIARLRHGLESIRDSNPGSAHRIAVQVLDGNPKAVEATCKPSNTD